MRNKKKAGFRLSLYKFFKILLNRLIFSNNCYECTKFPRSVFIILRNIRCPTRLALGCFLSLAECPLTNIATLHS